MPDPISFPQLNTLQGINIQTTIQAQLDSKDTESLTQNYIVVGDASGLSQGVAMSGDATIVSSGAVTVSNAAVIGKVLTGLSVGAGTVAATDTILQAFNKVVGNSGNVAVTSNLLTGLSAGAGTVSSADTVLQGFNKLVGNTQNLEVINNVLTGYVSGAGTISASDTILQGFNKINGNVDAIRYIVPNTQTDTYVLVLSDAGKLIIMNKGTANDLTVPANASVAFPVGTQIAVQQLGAGQTTIDPDVGVTLQAQPGLLISAQYGMATLIKVATDTWAVSGALSA